MVVSAYKVGMENKEVAGEGGGGSHELCKQTETETENPPTK